MNCNNLCSRIDTSHECVNRQTELVSDRSLYNS